MRTISEAAINDGDSALLTASRAGETELVMELLDKGAAIDEKSEHGGYTSLVVATFR